MYTEDQLLEQIRALGVQSADTLIVHTSLKAIGPIDTAVKSGAEVLIGALKRAVADGLLLIPAFTFANIRQTPVFDIQNTQPCVGAVPCVAVMLANRAYQNGDRTCVRSFHVSHSVVAFGADAYEYTDEDRHSKSPTPFVGSIGKLYERDAKILLVGVDMTKTTFIHAVDEYLEPQGMSAPYPITAIDYDGTQTMRQARNCQGPSRKYSIYEPYLKEMGGISYGRLGDAETRLLSARKCFDTVAAYRESVFKLEAKK